MVDCSPHWSYRPTFTSGLTPSTIPTFTETRARISAGGTLFRSHGVGSDKNTIEIEVFQSVDMFTLNVYRGGILLETYGPATQTENAGAPTTCSPNLIKTFRTLVNASSVLIEMPSIDEGGLGGGSFDASLDDAGCLSPFPRSFLSSGTGGPTDGAGLAAIRTGHDRSMIAIQQTELVNDNHTDDGAMILPAPDRRVQQWNGTVWVTYTPGGICP